MKSTIKLLIYDLLKLLSKNQQETCKEIEKQIDNGNIVHYLLEKYPMNYIRNGNISEATNLLKDKVGCFDYNESDEKNGLIHLILFLLDF